MLLRFLCLDNKTTLLALWGGLLYSRTLVSIFFSAEKTQLPLLLADILWLQITLWFREKKEIALCLSIKESTWLLPTEPIARSRETYFSSLYWFFFFCLLTLVAGDNLVVSTRNYFWSAHSPGRYRHDGETIVLIAFLAFFKYFVFSGVQGILTFVNVKFVSSPGTLVCMAIRLTLCNWVGLVTMLYKRSSLYVIVNAKDCGIMPS